ncbi:MAG TPA: nucleotide exchange factor GrpE [bacterium]
MKEKELKDKENKENPSAVSGEQETPEQDTSKSPPTTVETLEKLLSEKETEISQMKDKYLRALADLDNFKKRTEKEKAELFNYGLMKFINELLPVQDSLDRAISELEKKQPIHETILDGIRLVSKKFRSVLEKVGVREIDSINKEFNPAYHEALGEVKKDDIPPMTVVQEFEKGYLLKDRLLRPSKVLISKKITVADNDSSVKNMDVETAVENTEKIKHIDKGGEDG